MAIDELEKLNAGALRDKLLQAERKYYTNLHTLQDKLEKLDSIQKLGKGLLAGTTSLEALDKLVEISVRDMSVEKALFLECANPDFRVAHFKGYSRRKASELDGYVMPGDDPHIAQIRSQRKARFIEKTEGPFRELVDLCQMVVVPVASDGGKLYGIYVVGFSEKKLQFYKPLQEQDIDFFSLVASQVSSTLQNLSLSETFKKFVPRQFLDRLAKEGLENIALGQADSDMVSILFSDIRNFTTVSETLQPQELLNLLNGYFEKMNAPIHDNHGFVDKFIGDAIMALFADEDPALSAKQSITAAIQMQDALKEFNRDRRKDGYAPIAIGVGIHTGDVIIGTVGSEDRMDSTVLGDAVNLASRIESLTKRYDSQIIISSQTYRLVEHDPEIVCRELDFVRVKGKEKAEIIYEVYNGNPADIFELKRKSHDIYHNALSEYLDRNWDGALKLFEECLQIYKHDDLVKMYVERCQLLKETPPPLDWDGIVDLKQK